MTGSDNPDGPPGVDVSVVVVTYNGLEHLKRLLPALARTRGVSFETILVDNDSSDGTEAWVNAHHPGVRCVASVENTGFGAGNRRGVMAARGRYVAFLNNDTEPDPDWLRVLFDAMERDDSIGAACSELRLLEFPDVLNARGGGMTRLGIGYDVDFRRPVQPAVASGGSGGREVLFPTAAAMLMRTDFFLQTGGFDPAFFMYHEDVDLGWRIWLAGRRVVCCPGSVVGHHYGGTTLQSIDGMENRIRLGARHLVRSLLKCYSWPNALLAIAGVKLAWLARGRFGLLWHVGLWNFVRLGGTMLERARIQKTRRSRDRDLFERGLIDRRWFPPVAPEVPRRDDDWRRANLAVNPELRTAFTSAMGRLGPGWMPPPGRAAADRVAGPGARATLRVPPSCAGRLVVRVHAAAGQSPWIRVGGIRADVSCAGGGGQVVELPLRSDPDGLVQVEIGCAEPASREAGAPHRSAGGSAVSGLTVESIEFHPAEPVADTTGPGSVSVVIPTFNRRDVLERTLAAMEVQTEPPLEVIVVDDGSGDGTAEILRKWVDYRHPFKAKVFFQSNGGAATARNRGVGDASGDLIVFLGDDTVPAPDFLSAHARAHEGRIGPCVVVGFTDWDRASMRVTPLLEHVNRFGYQFGYALMPAGGEVPFTCLYTSNLSAPAWLLRAEPFHEGFEGCGWEDTELGYRLSLRGVPLIYRPEARTVHYHPMTADDFLRRQRRSGKNYLRLLSMHPELEGVKHLPARAGYRWFEWMGEALVRPSAALLSALDRVGVPLPALVYRVFLVWFFLKGLREASGAGDPGITPPDAAPNV